jgi:hypothetical protein
VFFYFSKPLPDVLNYNETVTDVTAAITLSRDRLTTKTTLNSEISFNPVITKFSTTIVSNTAKFVTTVPISLLETILNFRTAMISIKTAKPLETTISNQVSSVWPFAKTISTNYDTKIVTRLVREQTTLTEAITTDETTMVTEVMIHYSYNLKNKSYENETVSPSKCNLTMKGSTEINPDYTIQTNTPEDLPQIQDVKSTLWRLAFSIFYLLLVIFC